MGLLDDAIREHLELRRRAGADAGEVARVEQEALGPVVRGVAPAADEPAGQNPAEPEIDAHQLAIDDAPIADPLAPAELIHEQDYEHEVTPQSVPTDQDQLLDQHAPLAPAPEPAAASDLAGASDPAQGAIEHEQYAPPAAAGLPTEEYDLATVHAAVHGDGPEHVDPPGTEGDLSRPAETEPEGGPAAQPPEGGPQPNAEQGQSSGESQPHPTQAESDAGGEKPAAEDVLERTPEFLEETPEHDRLWFEQAPPKDFDFDK